MLALNSQSFCLCQQSCSWIIGVNHHAPRWCVTLIFFFLHLFPSWGESMCAHVCAYVVWVLGIEGRSPGWQYAPLASKPSGLLLVGHFCDWKILQHHPHFPALGKARCCVIETLETLGEPHRQAPTCRGASFGGGPSNSEIVFSVCTLWLTYYCNLMWNDLTRIPRSNPRRIPYP